MTSEPADDPTFTDSGPTADSASEAAAEALPVDALVGQSVYDERHRKIGVIQSITATRDNGLICIVTGTAGSLGIGRVPLEALTLIGDKLYRNSLATRLRAMKW